MISVAGSPRSLAEMDFVAGMRACEVCGDWRPVAWRTGGTGDEWIARAACPRCANERAYLFHVPTRLTPATPKICSPS